jgi:multidrug efflux pump subunit AcrA (membrane-fusion protein)
MRTTGSTTQGDLEREQEMNRRYAILGLAVFLALALAVPALGGPSNPVANISATAKGIANKALKKAKTAQNIANGAQSTANTANSTADSALIEAKKGVTEAKKGVTNAATAQNTANGAKTAADAAKTAADSAKAAAAAAQAAADAANANANTRVKSAHEVFGTATASNTVTEKNASSKCPENEVTLGGGFRLGGAGANSVTVTDQEELFYGDGWFVAASTISGTPTWSLQALAVCGQK